MKIRKIVSVLCLLLTAVLWLASCTAGEDRLIVSSDRTEAQRTYYVGDTFDSFVEGESGTVARIPKIYVRKADGTCSEDVSHSDRIAFSGYDPTRVGVQTVEVTYTTEDGKTLKASYTVNVVEEKILFIEADDNRHLISGSFRVGEKFTTYQTDEYGFGYGVTVWLHMESQVNPRVGFFTNEEKMREAVFDPSECKLDENGCFTEPGIFTVKVSFREFETTYSIRVTE